MWVPLSPCTPNPTHRSGNIPQIAIETLLGAFLGIIGAALYGSPLKQISWASEMRQQYAPVSFTPLALKLIHDAQ